MPVTDADGVPTLQSRIDAAIESAHREAGADDSFADFVGPAGLAPFLDQERKAAKALVEISQAAGVIVATSEKWQHHLDPFAYAVAHRFEAPPGREPHDHAEHIIGIIRELSDLRLENLGSKLPGGKGRPLVADTLDRLVLRNVVRAAMHHLAEQGSRYSGGWKKLARGGRAGPRDNGEYQPSGAALFVISAVEQAGLDPVYHEVDAEMTRYVRLLNEFARDPAVLDYASANFTFDDLEIP